MNYRIAVLIAVTAGALTAASPTIEQLLNSPFPTSLTAAPAGGRIAWVLNDRGVRNIWIAEPPQYQPRRLTSYTLDDGQEIPSLDWSRDGQKILYVRGGAANSRGEIPNPTSDPAGAEQAIWIVPIAGGAPKRIAEGNEPSVSPKGDRVAYLSRGQIWAAVLDGSAKPEQLVRARGQSGGLRWSPDGSRLAFASSRQDHGFIGVYEVASKSVRFLDASVDRDTSSAWSPDGTRIAFLRIPASREMSLFGPKRAADPFSIRIAEVASGRGRQVWIGERGRGSVFRGVVAENQILWGEGDQLVFPWEREGWTHLYSVSAAGGQVKLLTPGEFEVEDVLLTPDARHVLYSSNQDDIDRRHLFRVPVAGGRVTAVTSGKGIEWSPVMASDRETLAFLRSDARRPARAAIQPAGAAARDLLPLDFPSESLVEPQAVHFAAADGMRIPAQLFLPAGLKPGERRPAVIFFHGGSRRQMLLGFHYGSYYHNAYALNQHFANQGYVVLAVNYRSGIGYGMEFREALHYGATGASEFNDVVGAGLYLRARPDVDPRRIGLWGGSYGGYLTALGLARASELFAAGVDLHGVHDWNVVRRNFTPGYDPQANQSAARLAFESSPMAHVKTWRSPVLLIHGDDDRNVPFSESVTLAEALRAQGVEFEQLVFPDEVHGFLTHARWIEAYHATAGFFERRLKGKK